MRYNADIASPTKAGFYKVYADADCPYAFVGYCLNHSDDWIIGPRIDKRALIFIPKPEKVSYWEIWE